jgi:hypothetical protein
VPKRPPLGAFCAPSDANFHSPFSRAKTEHIANLLDKLLVGPLIRAAFLANFMGLIQLQGRIFCGFLADPC